MRRRCWRALACLLIAAGFSGICPAQKPLSWEEVRERFRKNNPNLLAAQIFVDESRANEITAGLRPNPVLSIVEDQFHILNPNPLTPFQNTQLTHDIGQLLERRNKRGLRVESARLATSIATTDLADLERQLTFNLRDAFVRALQAKSVLELATENLKYYDHVIDVNRERFKAGDISRADLARVELQRVQFESDLLNAQVNLRTAKIGLLSLMNERRLVDGFAILGLEYQRTGPDNTMGLSLTIPIRIFDRNQGEKERTSLEIRRWERLREGLLATIYRDVDSAYASVESVRALLRPYRDRYLPQAVEVRETVSFAYTNGGASLLEFLDAQKSYRDVQLNYRNLIGSYLAAVNQLSLAAGREVTP
ncbi:MAG: TolC family protein [Acidobacteria bacterium]|nr:TolC family protein [Acidobacteriota bacterium]